MLTSAWKEGQIEQREGTPPVLTVPRITLALQHETRMNTVIHRHMRKAFLLCLLAAATGRPAFGRPSIVAAWRSSAEHDRSVSISFLADGSVAGVTEHHVTRRPVVFMGTYKTSGTELTLELEGLDPIAGSYSISNGILRLDESFFYEKPYSFVRAGSGEAFPQPESERVGQRPVRGADIPLLIGPLQVALAFLPAIVALVVCVLAIIAFWRIHRRAGLPPALSLLIVIPVVGILFVLFHLAYRKWPSLTSER
jgi:hypothetical protein